MAKGALKNFPKGKKQVPYLTKAEERKKYIGKKTGEAPSAPLKTERPGEKFNRLVTETKERISRIYEKYGDHIKDLKDNEDQD